MSIKWTILLCSFALSCMQASGARRISYEEISSDETIIVGALGLPLGVVFEIEGAIVPARDTLGALFNSSFLFRVDKVNKRVLSKPVRMSFKVKDPNLTMPATFSALLEWKAGEAGAEMGDDEKRNLEKDYFGKYYVLTVVENGCFSGVPRDLPDNCAYWSASAYAFHSSLVVLAEGPLVEKKSAKTRQ